MALMELDAAAEVEELRDALASLANARDALAAELELARDASIEQFFMLEDSRRLAQTLEAELARAVRDATHRGLEAEIRRKLLAGVIDARPWQRAKPLARAERVERLLAK